MAGFPTSPGNTSDNRIGFANNGGHPGWHGVYFVGDTVKFTTGGTGAATSYKVYDYRGNLVANAAISGSSNTQFTVTPTAGGTFAAGWYRILFLGPVNDATYGLSYGSCSFCVIRNTAGFQPMPSFNTDPVEANSGGDAGTEFRNPVVAGVMGMGSSRLQIGQVSLSDPAQIYAPATGPGSFLDNLYACQLSAQWTRTYEPSDPVRNPWPIMVQFPHLAVDQVIVGSFGPFLCKNASIDGSKVFVGTGPGTTSGTKVTVSFPNASTIVETYDNLASGAAAVAAITGPSAYVQFVAYNNTASTQAPTAIGNFNRVGLINTVNYLYPFGVTHYEGPSNEPGIGDPTVAAQMNLFRDIVHSANPAAIAMGPCVVEIHENYLPLWADFFQQGGNPDAISTHMYGAQVNGDFNLGRYSMDAWFDLLARYGQSGKEVWCTESTQTSVPLFGVNSPRLANIPILEVMLGEQYGLRKERNQYWYYGSHGFWGDSDFIVTEDGSLMPQVVLYRVWAEESFGRDFHHAIDFGVIGNRVFLGNLYFSPSDGTSTAMVCSHSAVTNFTVTFALTGTVPATLTYTDGLGVQTTLTVTTSKVTMPVEDIPGYLQLPHGCIAHVDHCNNWSATPPPSISALARGTFSGSQPTAAICDNQWLTNFKTATGYAQSLNTLTALVPDTAEIMFNSTISTSQVTIFCGMGYQNWSCFTDFDVQTTTDGVTWTTRQTITRTNQTAFTHPMSAIGTGTTWEQYWGPEWIFDVPLGSTLSITGVRLNVRGTSYGDHATQAVATAGFGYPQTTMQITLQEVVVWSPSTPTPFAGGTGYAAQVEALSPVGYYRLGETSGTVAKSEVNSPTVDGTYQLPGVGSISPIPGVIEDGNGAQQISGSGTGPFDAYISFPLAAPADVFTIGFWHNLNGESPTGKQTYVHWGSQIGLFWNGGTVGLANSGGVGTVVATSSQGYHDGNWHFVVVTKNGASTHIYLDGLDVTVAGTNVTFSSGSSQASLYEFTNGPWSFDEPMFFTTALTAAQVLSLYYAAFAPSAVPVTDTSFFAPAPAITGTLAVGGQLQSSTGHWLHHPNAFVYEWQRSLDGSTWSDIGGATRSDYTVQSADQGSYIACLVTASNVAGAGGSQRSAPAAIGGSIPGVASYLVREEDGTSHLLLEDSSGSLLTEESGTAGPGLSVGEFVGVVPIF